MQIPLAPALILHPFFNPLSSPNREQSTNHIAMNTELQAKARKLFFQTELTKTEIAQALGMSRRTLHHWIKEQNWEYQKKCATSMPVIIAENCYHILANYTQQLLAPERSEVMISVSEVNVLHKLTTTIGKLKKGATLNEQIELLSNFMDTVQNGSPEAASAIAPYVSHYITTSAKASATASSAAPHGIVTPPTPEEIEKENELDRQYSAEEHPAPESVRKSHHPISMAYKSSETTLRRKSPPAYTDVREDLRRQDENIRHMFPVNTRYAAA
jgi:predicted DNA-binding protein (UPF0251 family)